ncbi:HyaD/HybD family hydrogenase maturation endopeptidase [Arcobacter sp. FWKO B]|uniref:HyaD/HybD family hydrogenase maturation endopeptidase n=1 Tax=Arcobacter sp. FWKO B TaxID=2593672 RepID=UPI0018A39F2F|nr:HyaD/HybD family hydrogenase maturation endopeptidase [Arcobacter sp. FWKO B]QOG12595.1 hydrogenase maturation protease [Arcobacter sp. FWKO B]
MQKTTAIVGAGTIIFKDEGVGVYAQRYLEENYLFGEDVTLVDGGVLGFQLMTYYSEYDNVLILDTISMDDKAGSIYSIPADELLGLGSYKQNAHEVEIVEMLEICSLLDKMANVHIVGIVPKDIESVEIDLTSDIRLKFDEFVSSALKQLDIMGVAYTKKDKYTNLDEIINIYSNPQLLREL